MWIYIIASIFGGIPLLIFLTYLYYRRNDNYWPSRGVFRLNVSEVAPLTDRLLLKEHFHILEHNAYKIVTEKYKITTYAGVMEFGVPSLVLFDLDLIKHVLVKDFDHFVDRRTFDLKKSDPYLNEMLINLQGQHWKNMRSTLSPTFSTGRIKRMYGIFNECGLKMIKFLTKEFNKPKEEEEGEEGALLELECRDLCTRFTMDVIASAAFGVDSQMFQDSSSNNEVIFNKMGKRIRQQFTGISAMLKLLIAIFAPKLLNYFRIPVLDREALNFFSNVIQTSATNRKSTAAGQKREDFLQLLIETQAGELKPEENEDGNVIVNNVDGEQQQMLGKASKVQLSDKALIAQSLLFFLAGLDTTETLLTLTLYELAINPNVQERLYDEIENALKDSTSNNEDDNNGPNVTYDILMNLQYLDMIISETLRKYPPGIRIDRKCTKNYTLPGTDLTIKKDQYVLIPVMGIHHDEKYYPNPEKFDPERFTPENKSARHPYAYMPFGHGPRSCIAMRFALVEAKVAIAHIILKYKLEPSSRTHIPMKFALRQVWKPEGGLWLKFTERTME